MNKPWKYFSEASQKCYDDMAIGKMHLTVWDQAYQVLKDAIAAERAKDPEYARELYEIDDKNDFKYGVEDWILDYQEMLDTLQEHAKLQSVCEELIAMFQWKEYSPTDLRFHVMIALQGQEKFKEAHQYGEMWFQEEEDNPYAAAALIYARMGVEDYVGAEQLVERFIPEGTVCSEENDMLFGAAEKLYEKTGKEDAQARIFEALERYDQELEKYLDNLDQEELSF